MCHGFDADGSNYDEHGNLRDWWSIDDRLVFKNKQNQLISIFNQYYVGGTTFCNGAQTIAEDMAAPDSSFGMMRTCRLNFKCLSTWSKSLILRLLSNPNPERFCPTFGVRVILFTFFVLSVIT